MLVSEAITEVLRIVNNPNRSSEAFTWIKQTMNELKSLGRWNWLLTDKLCVYAQYVPLPSDCREIYEPIVFDSAYTVSSVLAVATTSLPVAYIGVPYSATLSATGGTETWSSPSIPWIFENLEKLYSGDGHFRITNFGLEWHPRFTSGGFWLKYYRNMTIPTATTDVVDLPDEFAYRLLVWGASRNGLVSEDDYDRLQIANAEYQKAIVDLRAWDSRRGSANGWKQISGRLRTQIVGPILPANYSL